MSKFLCRVFLELSQEHAMVKQQVTKDTMEPTPLEDLIKYRVGDMGLTPGSMDRLLKLSEASSPQPK